MMTIVSTVFVPVKPTTRSGTNPTIYGTVTSPGTTEIKFVGDPQQEVAVDETKYEAETLGWARQRVAEAVRACAFEACVLNMPRTQMSMAVPAARAQTGAEGVNSGEAAPSL